tara:strand:- start:592 stop:1785 length:1194 start_codon:yes stop_codon:yes gene_type:complete
MNRTLKRPMFRMGGAAEGITSGLDRPGYKDGTDNRVARLTEEFQQRKSMFDKLNPDPQTGFMPGSVSSFLTNFGLNLMSQTPRGNIFSTAALAAKDPFNKFQTARAQEMSDRKALDQAILGDVISEDFKYRQQEKLIDAGFEEKKMELQNEIKLLEIEGTQDALKRAETLKNDLIVLEKDYELQKKYGTTGRDFDPGAAAKTSNVVKGLDDEKLTLTQEAEQIKITPENERTAEQNKRLREIETRLGSIDDIRANILKESSLIEKIGALDQTDQLNTIVDQNMAKGMTYEEAFKAALEQFKFLQNMADGGRAGYNVGGMTGMAAPQQTSQTIQESPTQDLTYSELRSRLPNSISDQVVQLLANSKQALLDFAEIRTQQDVDQFNQQYDVTLTLPQEG